ncbi:hypothetical protein BDW02DRAFT_567487 [Decorospora gaudefroyi]|uniref:Uncharacterized protein n=1 Tax=Decorospora gaudefroyi TaxID=184978 RepID=A0A6A5KIU8_9PLEO|nr:hypothetical protein BDW02DRAFT_567487 [Decorospora gaudefroyi]
MSYDYNNRYSQHSRHDSHHTPSRDRDAYAYSRREQTPAAAREKPADMRYSVNSRPYASSYNHSSYSAYEPRTSPPRRTTPQPYYRTRARKQTWPPSPSVEDEQTSLAKEASSLAGSPTQGEGEPPINTRGSVDQEYLLDEIEQPKVAQDVDHRFLDTHSGHGSSTTSSAAGDRRRRSFAERANVPHIKTDVADPPMFTERVRTPYGYSKPQKESTAPSPRDYFRSPEPMTPSNSSNPGPASSRERRDTQRDQNARPSRPSPSHSRHNSFATSRPTKKEYVFDETDSETDSSTHLRTERKPARYSFVKSDLQRDDLRTNLRDTQERPESRRRDSEQRPLPTLYKGDSSGSSKDYAYAHSPRSSSSSVNSGTRKSRPAPVDTMYANSSRPLSRPSSPSPRLPTRLRDSPPDSRPTSRGGGARPASPLSFSSTVQPPSPGRSRVPISEADWHSTYPPAPASDRSRPPSRYGRHETIPLPRPRIDIQSPSPSRSSTADSALPYPLDDQLIDAFMPPEQNYQFDHSTVGSPRQTYTDLPSSSSPSVPSSPYSRDATHRPAKKDTASLDESERARRTRSNSVYSHDGRRDKSIRRVTSFGLDKPLPSCPRSTEPGRYDDWYSLQGCKGFDICPSCYEGVFADTPYDVNFKQIWLHDWPPEKKCDFSNPWVRLAWSLTVKQRRKSLDLLYALADIADRSRPCPGDRAVGTDRVNWYGIPDQRDGLHVSNFAICSCDRRIVEALFPSLRGYFTKLSTGYSASFQDRYLCSLRTSSRRFPKYVELLQEIDADAQAHGQRPDINRFIRLARDNAFKGECARDKTSIRKPWHFIPSLPEFTVCEECYDELIWPATQSKTTPPTLPRLFNNSIQLVPGEDPDAGTSCCLYSPRMRRVWEVAVREEDLKYLERHARERKNTEMKIARERKDILGWLAGLERGTSMWERTKDELRELDRKWATWE